MVVAALVLIWGAILLGVWLAYRYFSLRERSLSRWFDGVGLNDPAYVGAGATLADGMSPTMRQERLRRELLAQNHSRHWSKWIGWLPWLIAFAAALTVQLTTGLGAAYTFAVGVVLGLIGSQLWGLFASRQEELLESQLADAIDIMVGALGAGAAVGPALEAAQVEIGKPLRPYLDDLIGGIRLGDDPLVVFRSLADRVPLETFLLFSTTLAVHSEVGGRLAPTLASVGRTIRDRIDISRRIRSNIAQSQFSTFAILGLTYLIAMIVWRNGPEPMEEFLRTSAGSSFVVGSIVLQAIGIVWMSWMSKPKF